MKFSFKKCSGLLLFILFASSTLFSQNQKPDWRLELNKQISLFGHRNWILVVDAAYPLQSKPAIKTIDTGEEQLYVLEQVLMAIDNADHVYPVVFLDKEIDYVSEDDAKGINNYRKELEQLLKGKPVTKKLHEELIGTIDEAAKTFNILVLKTKITIPYTSVFLRLDCGYWDEEKENNLRKNMKDRYSDSQSN